MRRNKRQPYPAEYRTICNAAGYVICVYPHLVDPDHMFIINVDVGFIHDFAADELLNHILLGAEPRADVRKIMHSNPDMCGRPV